MHGFSWLHRWTPVSPSLQWWASLAELLAQYSPTSIEQIFSIVHHDDRIEIWRLASAQPRPSLFFLPCPCRWPDLRAYDLQLDMKATSRTHPLPSVAWTHASFKAINHLEPCLSTRLHVKRPPSTFLIHFLIFFRFISSGSTVFPCLPNPGRSFLLSSLQIQRQSGLQSGLKSISFICALNRRYVVLPSLSKDSGSGMFTDVCPARTVATDFVSPAFTDEHSIRSIACSDSSGHSP